MKEQYVIVVCKANGDVITESHPQPDYPDKDLIEFSLLYAKNDGEYVRVEKRYSKA